MDNIKQNNETERIGFQLTQFYISHISRSTDIEIIIKNQTDNIIISIESDIYNQTPAHPLETYIRQSVDALYLYHNGILEIVVRDLPVLRVMPDEAYEAWNMVISNGFRAVSLPGGQLSIWSALK